MSKGEENSSKFIISTHAVSLTDDHLCCLFRCSALCSPSVHNDAHFHITRLIFIYTQVQQQQRNKKKEKRERATFRHSDKTSKRPENEDSRGTHKKNIYIVK